jgi:hypothetical protein
MPQIFSGSPNASLPEVTRLSVIGDAHLEGATLKGAHAGLSRQVAVGSEQCLNC